MRRILESQSGLWVGKDCPEIYNGVQIWPTRWGSIRACRSSRELGGRLFKLVAEYNWVELGGQILGICGQSVCYLCRSLLLVPVVLSLRTHSLFCLHPLSLSGQLSFWYLATLCIVQRPSSCVYFLSLKHSLFRNM